MIQSDGTFAGGRGWGVKDRALELKKGRDLSRVYAREIRRVDLKSLLGVGTKTPKILVESKDGKPIEIVEAKSFRDPFVVGYIAGLEGR